MYQCQMGKQTMGTPYHSLSYRTDNKMYRLQTPQAPIVQTNVHGRYKMDNYPNGANAVVGTY
jgi:DNA-directed RNA polymerase I subunit RPA2